MSYECHVDELSKKLSKRLGFLKQAQREMFFNSVVKPIMMYSSMIWDNCSNSCKQLILILQKRAARIILNADRETSSVSLFNRLNWLPFYKESAIKRNYTVPEFIHTMLIRNCDCHNRVTRHSNLNLVTPKYKRETEGVRSFVVRTSKQWNTLNINLRSQESVACFKRIFYSQFLSEQKATMLL